MSEPSNARPGPAASQEDSTDALPTGTRMAEFEIRQVLGAGGFGIVYRAWDEALQRDVALKEYMPVSLAGRSAGGNITLRSRTHEENFALGLQSFVNEARLLARFDQPALVKVFRFWEGNGTAYMAMPLYKGRNLRQLRKDIGSSAFDDAWMHALLEPLLGALEVMHEAEVYHRDIAPDNILWCDDSRPVLLDFGAARLVLGDRTQNVTAILKPQFAPIEQYAETQSMRQGPWTDLYALAGTCYFLLTGRAPLPATARVMGDDLEPLSRLAPPGCSPRVLQILDWMMAVRPQDRPQSVAEVRDALAGRTAVPWRDGAPAPKPDAADGGAGYEKTIQVTSYAQKTQRMPAPKAPSAPRPPAPAPVTRPRARDDDDDLETPERSVMLPPKSQSPLKALLLVLVLGAAAAGGWATRQQWMPPVGLKTAALAAAEVASAPATIAAASAPLVASAPVAEPASAAASQALATAANTAASAVAAPASEAAPVAPAPAPVAVAEVAPAHAAHAKNPAGSRKALEARLAAIALPPPVLPPANEAHVVAQAHTPLGANPEASAPAAAPAAATAPTSPRPLTPREVCNDQGGTARIAACIKRMCENEPRFAAFPICQRLHRQEDKQGASE